MVSITPKILRHWTPTHMGHIKNEARYTCNLPNYDRLNLLGVGYY